jgi:hypothetical protein
LASAQENASNPLASVNNVDVKSQYTSNDPLDRHDIFIDGAHMFHPKLKVKYELHYNVTDATGTRENDFEKLVFKPIYFNLGTTSTSGTPCTWKVSSGLERIGHTMPVWAWG